MYDSSTITHRSALEKVPYCFIPTKFLRDWKQWILKPTEVARPEEIDLWHLVCQCGFGGFAINPNSALDLNSPIALILKSDWDILKELK